MIPAILDSLSRIKGHRIKLWDWNLHNILQIDHVHIFWFYNHFDIPYHLGGEQFFVSTEK